MLFDIQLSGFLRAWIFRHSVFFGRREVRCFAGIRTGMASATGAAMLLIGTEAGTQPGEPLHVRGYQQAALVRISAELPEPFGRESFTEYRLQNRLNLRWTPIRDLTFRGEMRTRVFVGDTVTSIPGYADGIDTDDGWFNLSWMPVERDRWLLHALPDRLYAEWERGDWNVRVGRQRVNWGVNWVTHPNDIFNIYSFYDFDYPERPGSDAIRVQRFLEFGMRAELAVRPARDTEQSVAAALYAFPVYDYDVQVIGGYYRERLTAGAGWAGNLRGAGFKGEVMGYADLTAADSRRENHLIAALSLDYMFPGGIFLISEALYNQAGGRPDGWVSASAPSPDNPSLSEVQLTVQGTYSIHPLVDGTLVAVVYPDEKAVYISPSIAWSVATNWDLTVLGQFLFSRRESALPDSTLLTAFLKVSF